MATPVSIHDFKAIGKDYIAYEANSLSTNSNVWLSLRTLYNAQSTIAANPNQQLLMNPHSDDMGDHIIYFSGITDSNPLEIKYVSLKKENDIIKLKPTDMPFGWTDKRFRDIHFRSNSPSFSIKIFVHINWTNIRWDEFGRDTYFNKKDNTGKLLEIAPALYPVTGQSNVTPTPINNTGYGNQFEFIKNNQKDKIIEKKVTPIPMAHEDINW